MGKGGKGKGGKGKGKRPPLCPRQVLSFSDGLGWRPLGSRTFIRVSGLHKRVCVELQRAVSHSHVAYLPWSLS